MSRGHVAAKIRNEDEHLLGLIRGESRVRDDAKELEAEQRSQRNRRSRLTERRS
jgi:hypothetical protein